MSVLAQFTHSSNFSMSRPDVTSSIVEKINEMIEYCGTPDFRTRTLDYQKGYLDSLHEFIEEMYLQLNRSLEEELEELESTVKFLQKRT
jgi:formate dehydrogenase maturation protein FdhE